MNENSVSFNNNERSFEIWDFIEGRKNNEFNEYHLTGENNSKEEDYKFQDNLSGKTIQIQNSKNILSDIILKFYESRLEQYSYKFIQNGNILKATQKLEKISNRSVIQIFFLKKEKPENPILKKKKSNSDSYSISSSESENEISDEEIQNYKTLQDQKKLESELENLEFLLGFNYFENLLTNEEIIFKRYLFHLDYFVSTKYIERINEEILILRETQWLKDNPIYITQPFLFKNLKHFSNFKKVDQKSQSQEKDQEDSSNDKENQEIINEHYNQEKTNHDYSSKIPKLRKFSTKIIPKKKRISLKTLLSFFIGFLLHLFGFFLISCFKREKINSALVMGFYIRMVLGCMILIFFEDLLCSYPILYLIKKLWNLI